MALNLLRLGRLTGNLQLEERGERLLMTVLGQMKEYPTASPQMLVALDYAISSKTGVVLVPGEDGRLPQRLLQSLHSRFLPQTVMLMSRPDDRHLKSLTPLALGKPPLGAQGTINLCRDRNCREPGTKPEKLARLLADGKD